MIKPNFSHNILQPMSNSNITLLASTVGTIYGSKRSKLNVYDMMMVYLRSESKVNAKPNTVTIIIQEQMDIEFLKVIRSKQIGIR